MSSVVLDASAVLALLKAEPGADRVRSVLSGATVGRVNFSEVVAHYVRDGVAAEDARRLVETLSLDVVAFDTDQAVLAGALIAVSAKAGLSFGDRACLALAQGLGLPVLTADRPWRRLPPIEGLDIRFIR
jgi:PIN domain nuclease of toxin-antitoxin system